MQDFSFTALLRIWGIGLTHANIVLLLLSLVCTASFCWAIMAHFRRETNMARGMQIVSSLSLLFFAIHLRALWQGTIAPFYVGASGVFYVGSFFLFWWAVRTTRRSRLTLAYSNDTPEFITLHGPYRWIRHPFYTAYLLFWFAGVLATRSPLMLTAFFTLGTLYVFAARKEEAKFLASPLADEYRFLQQTTGMFLPRLGSFSGAALTSTNSSAATPASPKDNKLPASTSARS